MRAAPPGRGGRLFATTRLTALVLAAGVAVAACSGSDEGRATGATGGTLASPTALRRYEADKVTGTADQPIFQGSYGATQLSGTGPFKLERWDRNDKVVLVRNHTYWRPQPALDRVILRRIDDGSARRQALESGEIHGYWPVKAGDITPLRKAGFRVHELPNLTLGYLGFNQARPPWTTCGSARPSTTPSTGASWCGPSTRPAPRSPTRSSLRTSGATPMTSGCTPMTLSGPAS